MLLILQHAEPRVQAGKKKVIFTSNLPAPLRLQALETEVAAVKKLSGETDTAIFDGTSFSIMRQALGDNATVNQVLMAMHFDMKVNVDGSDAFLFTPALVNSKAVADIKKNLTPNHHGLGKAALEAYTIETTGSHYAQLQLLGFYETNGDTALHIAPGYMYEGRDWAFEATVHLPAAQALDDRPEAEWGFSLGLRYLF